MKLSQRMVMHLHAEQNTVSRYMTWHAEENAS